MRLRSFTITLVAITVLAIGFVTRRSATAAPPQTVTATAFAEDVEVTLRVTGIAHLIGDAGSKQRTLVIPNHKNADHDLLVLVNTKFKSALLDDERTVDGITYAYDEFPEGYEIDLAASGWIPPTTTGTLTADETGDQTDEPCPGGMAPRDSLHWLPRMSTVNKDAVTVKHSHQEKDPKAKHVLARMEITDGKLTSALQPSARKFEFDTNGATGGDFVQAVADYLVYKFTARVVTGQPFVLKARKFRSDKGDPEEWREIVRVTPVSNVVEITLANVIEDNFFHPEKITEIEHFHHYYDALHKPVKNIRKVTAGNKCDGGGADSGVECGPIRP
jgi:hypothetical protein